MRYIEGVSHVVKGNTLVHFANINQKILQAELIDLQVLNEIEMIEHLVPAGYQGPTTVSEVLHIIGQHLGEHKLLWLYFVIVPEFGKRLGELNLKWLNQIAR